MARTRHETASSVVVVTASELEDLPAPDRLDQLLQAVPNIQFGSGGEGPAIRGQDSTGAVRDLAAFLSGSRPRATITVDGRGATYYELAFGITSLWDLASVEVFRTPQTTTQGRNSIGGAIFVRTEDPTYDWQGRVRSIAGDAETRQASAVVSGPLVADQLALRLSGDLRRSVSASRISNGAIGVDPNRDDSDLVRFKLRAEPEGLAGARFDLIYAHGRSQMPQFEGIEPPYPARLNPNATYGVFAITTDSLTGLARYDPLHGPSGRLAVSFGKAVIRRHPTPGLGNLVIRARDWSIEPTVTWQPSTGSLLVGGLHYTRATLDQKIDLTALQSVRGTGAFSDVQHSLGIFGEGSVNLAAGLSLTAGLRYQRDRQVRQGSLRGSVLVLPLDYDRTFSAWLPKLSLAWDAAQEFRIGALIQRAYNAGGVYLNTTPNLRRSRIELFDAEKLWNFELFARARIGGGKLVVAANAFRYAIVDAQRSQSTLTVLPSGQSINSISVGNADLSWTKGLELQTDFRPSPRLEVSASLGLLDTRIARSIDSALQGRQFQRSPRFTAAANATWKPADGLTLSAQARHNSSYYSDDRETEARRISGSTTVNVKAAWSRGGLTLFGYARNLFDEFHLTYLFAVNGVATAGDPREVGVGADIRF